jgi:hypothetical protein
MILQLQIMKMSLVSKYSRIQKHYEVRSAHQRIVEAIHRSREIEDDAFSNYSEVAGEIGVVSLACSRVWHQLPSTTSRKEAF